MPRAVIGFFRSIIEGAERRLTVTVIVCASEYYDDIRIIIHRLIPVTKGWFCAAIVLDMLSGYARAADSVIPRGGKAAFILHNIKINVFVLRGADPLGNAVPPEN